ncbi:MAG: hypothetical protein J7497_02570 [Chitinophagaceae bacterium]|nr:hypothetical protein [Chitinophagaceae bacterium]
MTKTYTLTSAYRLLLLIVFSLFTASSFALVLPSSKPAEATASSPSDVLAKMKVEDFLALTPKKYKELTGEKLSLTQKMSLKYAQKQMRKALKENQKIDQSIQANAVSTSDFNAGGFILGLLLSIIGVLIAYLINDSTVIKWAWIGFGISAIIYLLILIF